MMRNSGQELFIALTLTALVGILTFAHNAWMPGMATMLTLLLIVVTFSTFAVFVWRERDGDEREQFLRHIAARCAFLITGAVLVIGIIYETFVYHAPDPWLSAALIAMVGGKVVGHLYARKKF